MDAFLGFLFLFLLALVAALPLIAIFLVTDDVSYRHKRREAEWACVECPDEVEAP